MPQLVAVKFAENEMPHPYDPGGVEEIALQDFVVAEREGTEDVGFVAGIEYVSRQQLKLRSEPHRRIVRLATDGEKEAFFVRKAMERKALTICKERSRALKLPMKITRARIDPRDGRVVFHFTSESRVDFRQLVRELSVMLKSRVELWQIGVRDEAKMVDGVGICGLRTCCSAWLTDFHPINLRMAKDQDISLPPAKLSGLCGRLLCCLSYEVDQYREMSKSLLPKGSTIRVDDKDGVIIDRNVLLQSYTVMFSEGGVQRVKLSELSEVRIPDQMKRMGERLRAAFVTEEAPAPDEESDAPEARPVASPRQASTPPGPAPAKEEKRPGERDGAQKKRRRGRRSGKRGTSEERGEQGRSSTPADGASKPRPGGKQRPGPKAKDQGARPPEAKDGGDAPQGQGGRRRGKKRGRRRGGGKPGGSQGGE